VALLVLTAAFDTLDHPILLKRLETTFGVRGTVLDWCVSYLSGRFRSVIVDSVVSASRPLVYPSPGFRVGTGFVYLVLSAFVGCDFCPTITSTPMTLSCPKAPHPISSFLFSPVFRQTFIDDVLLWMNSNNQVDHR